MKASGSLSPKYQDLFTKKKNKKSKDYEEKRGKNTSTKEKKNSNWGQGKKNLVPPYDSSFHHQLCLFQKQVFLKQHNQQKQHQLLTQFQDHTKHQAQPHNLMIMLVIMLKMIGYYDYS